MSYRHDYRRSMIATGLVLGGLSLFIPHVLEIRAIREQGLFAGPTYDRRLLLAGLALFVAVLLTGLVARARDWRGAAMWTWLGSLAGVVLLLVLLGPGYPWPLAIATAAVYAAIPVATAGLAGHAIHRLRSRRTPSVLVATPHFESRKPTGNAPESGEPPAG